MVVESFPPIPSGLKADPEIFEWMLDIVQRISAQGQSAGLSTRGLVLLAAAVSNAAASSVSVDSADASDLATVITLANEIKGDVNQLVTDVNAIKDQLNALLASERAAGQLDT